MLSGAEERCSRSTKPPGSFALASGRSREEKRRVPSTSGQGRCWGIWGAGEGGQRWRSPRAAPACRAVGEVPWVQPGQCLRPPPRGAAREAPCLRHARLQRDRHIEFVLFVKRLALKIKNSKARERENANLTAASERRRMQHGARSKKFPLLSSV